MGDGCEFRHRSPRPETSTCGWSGFGWEVQGNLIKAGILKPAGDRPRQLRYAIGPSDAIDYGRFMCETLGSICKIALSEWEISPWPG